MTDEGVRKAQVLNPARVQDLLERALKAAFSAPDAATGLRSVVSESDTVGIKLNCLAGSPLSPTRELADALVGLLKKAGVLPDRIVFFERSERDITKGGFTVKRYGDGPLFVGHDTRGYAFEREVTISGKVGSCLSSVVTRKVSVLINLGVLKDHNLAGLSAGMKNLFGIIHNPNKYHDNRCDPYVADVTAFDPVQRKLRLTVIDALTAQCEGGPGYLPAFAWPYNGVMASIDPVALDRVAWDVLEARRKAKGLPSLAEAGREPVWIRTAAGKGLGNDDPTKFRIERGG
jgi:uncharacterized protein (DUF362 family)